MPSPGKRRNNPVSGAAYFLRGLGLITRKGVKRYVAAPLLINTVLFAGAIWWGWNELPALRHWVDGHLPTWLQWLDWLLIPLFVLTAMLVMYFGFAVVGNVVAAPFNGLLAEAVERQLSGKQMDPGGGWSRILTDLIKSLYSELRKLLYFALRAIPVLILSLLVAPAAPILWFLFGAWMLAIEYADYPMGNHGMTFPRQRAVLRRKRLLGLGFGGMATLALMIPGRNFLVIPAGVAGATAMWVEQLSEQ